jgi:AcrR family transcriptional regulator
LIAMADRSAQRRRTRKAIVDAAMELLASGETPSMARVAEAADVSRRTVYTYFPTFEQLQIDATLGLLGTTAVEGALGAAPGDEDVEARVERLVRALQRSSVETERLGRSLIRLTVDDPDLDKRPKGRPTRGYRRVEWIESALAPLRDELGKRDFERLVSALTLFVGWEALVVMRDLRGLTGRQAEQISAWAARALVRAAIEEAG